MAPLRFVLITAFLACYAPHAAAQIEIIGEDESVFDKPLPDYPQSEHGDGREGWVLVGFDIARSGLISDIYILESSGSEVFERSALETMQHWRFTPGDERSETALVNFVYDTTFVNVSRRFLSLNERVHRQIDKGDLEKAEEYLAESRDAVANGWLFDYAAAKKEARRDKEPLMIVLRCVP